MTRRCSFLVCVWVAGVALPVSADLVGHWRFDQGEGEVYPDSSANANHAVPERFAGWSADTPPTAVANPASVTFDGRSSYAASGFAGVGGDSARTVAVWVKTTATNDHGIVAWGNSFANGEKWHLRLNSNPNNGVLGALRIETQGDFTIGSTFVADGMWHHLAGVYPGGGELGTTLLYVDGVLEAAVSNNASTQPVNTSLTADPVTVGRRNQTGNLRTLAGAVDDVRIYDRALNAQEIAGLAGASPSADGLVWHLPFDEGSGLTARDLGGGGHDAMLFPRGDVAPTWSDDAPAHLMGSLEFSGGGDLLQTSYPGVQGSASRSVTFWFKTSNSGDNGILGWGDSTIDGKKWHARLNSTAVDGPVGALRVEIQGGRAVATTPVADGTWHHAAIVFEEDADPDITDVVFFLDGEPDPIAQFTQVPIDTDSSASSAHNVTIGGRYQGAIMRPHIGHLADVRIYDSGLSQQEVQEIMAGGGAQSAALQVVGIDYRPDAGEATLTWNSRAGESYSVFSSTDLRPASWLEVVDGWLAEPGSPTTSFTVPAVPAGTARMFWRVVRE